MEKIVKWDTLSPEDKQMVVHAFNGAFKKLKALQSDEIDMFYIAFNTINPLIVFSTDTDRKVEIAIDKQYALPMKKATEVIIRKNKAQNQNPFKIG